VTGDLTPYREPGRDAAGSLVVWAQEAHDAHQIAVSLARTSFVPKPMQGHPEEVTAAILTGRELGLKPMAALRSIHVIEGTPTVSALGLRGILQDQGHEIWTEESTDSRAVVCGRRRGSANTERVVWTLDRARKAGLANKQNWQRNPAAMLVARATAEVARRVAADALMAMPYAAEEITDDPGAPAMIEAPPAVTAPRTKPRTLKRAGPPPAVDSPADSSTDSPADSPGDSPADSGGSPSEEPPPAEPEPEPEPGPGPDLMTEPQRKALMAVYRKVGGDRDSRIAHASDVLGRDITTFAELTKREAMVLLDALTAEDEL
jgi:hypothetical protein